MNVSDLLMLLATIGLESVFVYGVDQAEVANVGDEIRLHCCYFHTSSPRVVSPTLDTRRAHVSKVR